MRTGVLGGTFDPVHHGHLVLARAAKEEFGLDRVIFVPAKISPHKTGTTPSTAADRLAMIRLAVANEPGFEVCDCELRRPPPSYTVDTLRELKSRHPQDELHLLIGADNVAKFDTWHRPEEIARLARIVVLDRAGAGATARDWPVVRRTIGISSTDIRARAGCGLSIRYLTPDGVCDYITEKGLYRNA
ncbi:MAG: nicotinate (nicotinamide) nucleotide adenylyltransferase [Chthoniobacterales bacterium]|nr:nicotinate (nicotinamide) nucleotide adenylyltransferase [Chthoniobacterales bacterium]